MVNPDHSYSLGPNQVAIYGQQVRLKENPTVSYEQALELGAHRGRVAQLIVAADATVRGHKLIVRDVYNEPSMADGVLISQPNAAGIIQTADCAALVLYDGTSGRTVLAHAGRPALSPSGHCASCTVVNNALHALVGNGPKDQVSALVTGNICGSCFRHDHESARPLIAPFLRYPDVVFADRERGGLDLYQVIRHELVHHGVPVENIRHESVCTLEHDHLSSHRRGDKTRNTIIVVRRD